MQGVFYEIFKVWFKIIENLFPDRAQKWAVRLFFSPPKFKTPQREKDYLLKAQKSRVDFRIYTDKLYQSSVVAKMLDKNEFNSTAQKDHYTLYELGTGQQTILLVHGWAGRASQMGEIAGAFAEQGFKTISFDAFAHVNSLAKQTTVIEFAEIVKDIHSKHGPFKAVIGHSLGGIALGNSILKGIKSDLFITIGSPTTFQFILEEFCKIINANKTTLQYIRDFTLDYVKAALEDFSLANVGDKLDIPGLIIHDKQDKEAPYEQALLFNRSWQKGVLVTTEGLGHSRILRDKEVISLILNYVSNGEISSSPLDHISFQTEAALT